VVSEPANYSIQHVNYAPFANIKFKSFFDLQDKSIAAAQTVEHSANNTRLKVQFPGNP